MNITPVRIYINGNGSISFYGTNNSLITNLQNLNGAKVSDGQIIFDGDDKTISFYVYQLTAIESATFSLPYSVLDSRFFNPSTYSAKLNQVYQDICEYVLVNKNGGASFVGGVVAVYPNFASFPATGQEAVIYIDEGTNQAYFWDGTSYQLLVSTGVQQYASFALFPVTGSANVIYIDMANLKPYVWDGAAYESIGGDVVWGGITGTLAAQTDLQAALDAKFDDPTGTTAEYIRGDGTLATFPTITSGTVTSVGTTGLISGGPITSSGTITTAMATNKLVGRYSASTGIMEEISVGSGLTLTGAGVLNNTATPTPTGYYGAWQDNATQTAAASNTGYAMIFGTVDLENQVRVVTNGTNLTRITFDNTGIYNLQFSSQFQNTDSQEHDVTIWLRLNGVDVPASSGFVSIPAKHGSTNGHAVTSWNYLLNVVAGQYYELMWSTSSNTHVTMQFYAAGSPPPSAASVILTVTQQAGILAGTGITAINSLTGAVQTLATGTSGTDFAISSASSTHTFNLPTASAANRGALSSADWSAFNGKFTLPALTSGSVLFSNGTTIAQDNANLFFDDTNNRLGIGTATPTKALTVKANANDEGILLQSATGGTLFQVTRDGASNNTAEMFLYAGGAIRLAIRSTANFSYFNGGNFGIGTTTDAGFKLDVNGTARVQGNAQFGTGFYWDNTNARLGIGTSNPSAYYAKKLVVAAPDEDGVTILANTISSTSYLAFADGTVGNEAFRGYISYKHQTDQLTFGAAGSLRMTLSSGGNLLINTTTDAGFKLDVNGTARVSGTTTITPATLTGTAATSALDISQTWNTTGTPIALKVNITDTASAALSDLISLQVGGSVRFRVLKSGFFTHNTGGEIAGNLVIGGSTIDASSQLEVRSTTKGFLPPRQTLAQRTAIASPAVGLIVYQTDLVEGLYIYKSTGWQFIV